MAVDVALGAEALSRADAVLVAAGAGMGVDSGLPDFRGPEGFWRAYPPYRRLGLGFTQMASPARFADDPELAWGFYGHRLDLYRSTEPHAGFRWLLDAVADRPHFVFTSNVDGQFQAAGWPADGILEVHGSIHHLQCTAPCTAGIWPADGVAPRVDGATMRAIRPLPRCPGCGGVARPNILMFGDGAFLWERSAEQEDRYRDFRRSVDAEGLVVVELGAGTAVPTVRWESEQLQGAGATLIRINPRESHGPRGTLSMATGALEALSALLGR